MKRAFLVSLSLVGLFLSLPVAGEPLQSSADRDVQAVAQADSPLLLAMLLPPNEECIPHYVCNNRVYSTITFIRQKPNLKCVYSCTYSETCTDLTCGEGSYDQNGSHRVRIDGYALDQCPDPGPLSFCSGGEWIPEGTE